MEKTISPEERIKRAEEIYYRRKIESGNGYARVNVQDNKKDLGMLKKLILQIMICIVIYAIFYMINNTKYIFSDSIISKTKDLLSYDINITNLYNNLNRKAKDIINLYFNKEEIDNDKNEDKMSEEEKVDDKNNQEIQNDENSNPNNLNAVGGENVENISQSNPLTQMELDAKGILDSKSLIIPLNGVITSRFGIRESTNPIVTRNHTGIDIAAQEGTVFIASMEGIVKEVSSEGDLGNHIKIANEDVETVYAHCKNIYVKEGEKIIQGQKIGEVGQTRKCNRSASSF